MFRRLSGKLEGRWVDKDALDKSDSFPLTKSPQQVGTCGPPMIPSPRYFVLDKIVTWPQSTRFCKAGTVAHYIVMNYF